MKLTYYKYFIKHGSVRHQYSIAPLLRTFCAIQNRGFRNSFQSRNNDSLFLFPIDPNIFLFAIAKDDELIKAINENQLSHDDICSRLTADERLGFASYVYVSNNFYGIASTFYGPRNKYWTSFVNELFRKLGLQHYLLMSAPFPLSTTRGEAQNLVFKGQTIFEVNRNNPLFNQFFGLLGINNTEAEELEVRIRPKRRSEMPTTVDGLLSQVSDVGLNKFILKARSTLEDSLTDYYITGTGHISDCFEAKHENEIAGAINQKIQQNGDLTAAVQEYANDQSYLHMDIPSITGFNDPSNWTSHLQNFAVARDGTASI